MYSRLVKALKKLGSKCTAAGTQVSGDNVDGIVECIAEHYAVGGGTGCDCAINVADFQKVMEKATDITLDRSCETVSEVIAALAKKLSFEQMNGEFEYSEKIVDGAFYSWRVHAIGSVTNTDIIFPETYNGQAVTGIDEKAFQDNTNITSIVVPDCYTWIGFSCFDGCTSLESAELGDLITVIKESTFYQAELKRVKFGSGINQIMSYAFYSCPLELLDFREATVVPTLDDGTIFVGMAENCKIVVPDALYDSWVADSMWSNLENATYVKASEYTEA